MTISADKKKALEATLQQIEKKFGKESVVDFNKQIDKNIKVIPSGSLLIDAALGVGGYPKGRIIEIFGQESSGKTTLTLHAIAEAQKQGMVCAFVDAEYAFDQDYAETFGIDVNDDNTFKLFHPDSGEDAFEIVDSLIRSGAVDVIVVDSVAALVPKAELEGTMEDNQMGLQARMMSKALRKITGSISKTNCTLFLINQTRMKIGVMYGNPETTTGGNALKFYASIRIEVRKSTTIKDGDTPIGHEMVVKVVKNKVAPPFKTAKLTFMYGEGISKLLEIIDVGIEMGIIEKSGGWYTIEGERVSGKDRLKEFLEKNPDTMKKLEDKIRVKLTSGDSKVMEEENESNEKVDDGNAEETSIEEETKTKSSGKKSKKK